MNRIRDCLPRWAPGIALAALVLLSLPPARNALESSMSAQMLLQFPLLGLCGFALAGGLPETGPGARIAGTPTASAACSASPCWRRC